MACKMEDLPGALHSNEPFPHYSSYYKDFFVLRFPVTIDGKKAEVIFPKGRSKPCLLCKELNVTLELSETIATQLFNYGVQRLKGFYYDQSKVLLASVDFLSKEDIQRFLSNKDTFVKQAFRNALKVDSRSHFQVDISVSVDIYLMCFSGTKFTVHQVTSDNHTDCIRKWKQSKMPEFSGTMFENPEPIHTGMQGQ